VADVAIVVPMLGRPHTIVPLVDSIHNTTESPHIIFGCSPGDVEVIGKLKTLGLDLFIVDGPTRGDYARKINTGYRLTDEPLLFTAACDLRFHAGWLEAATAKLTPSIGVVGTNDLGSRRVMMGNHSTHSLVTRDYVDKFGTIDRPGLVLHEGYPHEFVDDEFVQTAIHRNAFAFAFDSHVEHLHPAWGKAPTDELYDQTPLRMRMGRKLYRQREHLWT
jgi:hypothetical protein